MHVAVLPPNGSKQSGYSCDDVRACVMHRCTHFDFLAMNLAKVFAVFDPQRYSAGVACAGAGLGTSPMVAATTMARNGARNVAIMTSPFVIWDPSMRLGGDGPHLRIASAKPAALNGYREYARVELAWDLPDQRG
jgi:hypothetical protein